MKLTARIPKKIIFSKKETVEDKKLLYKNWSMLGNEFEDKIAKISGPVHYGIYWAIDSQKQIDRIESSTENIWHVHDNVPCNLRLFGIGSDINNDSYKNKDTIYVVTPSGYLVKMSNEVLVNAILFGKVRDDRTLPGEFVFAIINNVLLPIQVGSGIHKAAIAKENKRKKVKIKPVDLFVGQAYSTFGGNTAIFLGFVNTEVMKSKTKRYTNITTILEVKYKKKKLSTLWFKFDIKDWLSNKNFTPEEIKEQIFERLNRNRDALYLFSCKDTYSFIEPINNFIVTLPEDIVFQVRRAAEKNLVASNYEKFTPHGISYYEAYSRLCNMSLFGTEFNRSKLYDVYNRYENIS